MRWLIPVALLFSLLVIASNTQIQSQRIPSSSAYLAIVFSRTSPTHIPSTISPSTTSTTSTASATATAPLPPISTPMPTLTATDDPFDNEPTIDIDQDDEDPVVGQDFVLAGTVIDGNGDGISGVQVTVTYTYQGIGENAWCTATTSGPDGDWKCTIKVPADFQGKDVTWTGTIVVNGRTVQETYEYDFSE